MTRKSLTTNIKRMIFERDSHKCQCCFRKGREIHHIKWVIDGGTDDLENLILLCGECHLFAPTEKEFSQYKEDGGVMIPFLLGKAIQKSIKDKSDINMTIELFDKVAKMYKEWSYDD